MMPGGLDTWGKKKEPFLSKAGVLEAKGTVLNPKANTTAGF